MTAFSLWLALLVAGNVLLVTGLLLTRLTWRPDVKPFGRRSPMLQVWAHPERFATAERVRLIRAINLLGAALMGTACVLVVREIVVAVMRG